MKNSEIKELKDFLSSSKLYNENLKKCQIGLYNIQILKYFPKNSIIQ